MGGNYPYELALVSISRPLTYPIEKFGTAESAGRNFHPFKLHQIHHLPFALHWLYRNDGSWRPCADMLRQFGGYGADCDSMAGTKVCLTAGAQPRHYVPHPEMRPEQTVPLVNR